MAKSYREFNFEDDIELMNLTYQMNTGNFMNYEEESEEIKDERENIGLPKFGL